MESQRLTLTDRYWRWIYSLAGQRIILGVPVRVLLPSESAAAIWAKVERALTLIHACDPRSFNRLSRLVDGVFVFGDVGPQAYWSERTRLITIQEAHVMNPRASPGEIASTLVHETTHAWLDAKGFSYDAECRQRVEAICVRSELAFARKVPDSGRIVSAAEWRLALPASHWTDAGFTQRARQQLRSIGIPKWLARVLLRVRRRRAA